MDEDEQIILNYACGEITKEELFEVLPLYLESTFLITQFEDAIMEKNSRRINF